MVQNKYIQIVKSPYKTKKKKNFNQYYQYFFFITSIHRRVRINNDTFLPFVIIKFIIIAQYTYNLYKYEWGDSTMQASDIIPFINIFMQYSNMRLMRNGKRHYC